MIPVSDDTGALVNLQFIHPDGSKTFLKRGRVKGCLCRILGCGAAIWANRDFDQPVDIVDEALSCGTDGRLYQRVRHDGRDSYVPLDQIRSPARICICEGFATAASVHEATGATAIVAFDAGNLKAVAEIVRTQFSDANIVIAADDDWKTKGNPGLTKATEAACAVGAKLAVPNFGVNRRDKDTDFNDLANFIGREAVKRDIDAAFVPEPAPEPIDPKAEISRLATLGKAEYDRERVPAAKRLGIRVSTLDEEVAKQRSSASGGDHDLPHWRVEPWPQPVDGAALLEEIAAIFSRHIVLPKHAATALALWVMHAWAFDASDVSPFLLLRSPEKRCGKSSVLIILQYLTPRSELAGNISAAAIFRYVEEKKPTLLIDEGDTFLQGNDEIRGILNAGHIRTAAYVIRTVEIGGNHVARRFSVWAPKAIATIGDLADTLADRSITIVMQRKTRDQKVERLRRRDNSEFAKLRQKALRWAQDNMEALDDADAGDRTQVPAELHDRAADNWRPLLAIADRAGGDLAKLARAAALALSGVDEPSSVNTLILADIRAAFRPGESEVATKVLIKRLTKDLERPWADYRKGKPITDRQLASLLGKFGIRSETLHVGRPDAKGYKRARFEEVWSRYLPPENNQDASKPADAEGSKDASEGADAAQSPFAAQNGSFDPSKRPNSDEMGTSATFSERPDPPSGRMEKPQEVPAAQRFGRLDGSEGGIWPEKGEKTQDGAGSRPAMADGGTTADTASAAVNSGRVPPSNEVCDACGRPGQLTDVVFGKRLFRVHHGCVDALYARERAADQSPPPVCARCGRNDGRLQRHHVRVNGVEREAFLHSECWHDWQIHGPKKIAPEWRQQL